MGKAIATRGRDRQPCVGASSVASAASLSPLLTKLLKSARTEEELLLAMRAAVQRGEEGKDEVFKLATQLTRNINPRQSQIDRDRIRETSLLLPDNCANSAASVFLEQ